MSEDKNFTDRLKKTHPLSEENLAFEMAEDEKLRRLGIDPDGDPVAIMVKLDAMGEERRAKLASPPESFEPPQ